MGCFFVSICYNTSMALQIIWNDILQEKADAIVTPASRNPRIGTGLDKLVHQVVDSQVYVKLLTGNAE